MYFLELWGKIMNIASAIIVIIVLMITIKYRGSFLVFESLFSLYCILELNEVAGYFCYIGSYRFSYQEFVLLFLVLYSVLILLAGKVDKKCILMGIMLVIVILAGILYEIVFPSNRYIMPIEGSWDNYIWTLKGKEYPQISFQTFMWLVRILIYIIVGLAYKYVYILNDMKYERLEKFFSVICGGCKIHICIIYIELITKLFFHSNLVTDFRNIFLGRTGVQSLMIRGSMPALCGLTAEPSHLAVALLWMCIVFICYESILGKSLKFWIVSSVLLMILSMSFTTLILMIALIVFLLIKHYLETGKLMETKSVFALCFITIVSILVFCFSDNYYVNRFQRIVDNIGNSDLKSIEITEVRLLSIYETFQVYITRPVLGLGLGTNKCFSGIIIGLSNIGLAGIVFWFFLVFHICGRNTTFKSNMAVIVMVSVVNLFKGDMSMYYCLFYLPVFSVIYVFWFCRKMSLFRRRERVRLR